ncbi:MAG: biotin/lipoate--protein ligase family protein [Hyphomicrobiaceae bacterium]
MTDVKPTDPTFPPLLDGRGVSVPDQSFAVAVDGARSGELGAGSVIWARNTSVMDWAIVLEPEVPLGQATQMVPLALVAAGDCVGALTPPQVGLMFRWPGDIMVNGGKAGFAEIAASSDDVNAVPDWMVVRVMIRITGDDRHEPGERPEETSLDEEGCGDLTRTQLVESYSRHFMTWMNTWTDDGFHPVHSAWLYRAWGLEESFSAEVAGRRVSGTFAGLDEDGNLLLKRDDGAMSVVTLAEAMPGVAAT